MTKKLLIIAAVAVMLVGATNAYAYHEWWDGWFNSGDLTYLGATFEYTEGSGVLEDTTNGDDDEFFVSAVSAAITFTCESGEYAGYYIKLWPGASGHKDTGQRGQKEAEDGEWTGLGYSDRSKEPMYYLFDFGGTWDTDDGNDYFDYTDCPCPPGGPPIYSADWDVTSSNPPNVVTGGGTSSGERTYYED